MKAALAHCGLALAAALVSSCSIGEGDYFGDVPEPKAGHLRWCNSGEPEYLDPGLVTSTTGVPIVEVLFDGLANHGPDADPIPGLAKSWDFDADLRRFTFHLRDDAHWSNGRLIVADDFAFHIARTLHPQTASRNAESHWNLKNGKRFTSNRARKLLTAVAPFSAGEVVEIVEVAAWRAPSGGELFAGADAHESTSETGLFSEPTEPREEIAYIPAGSDVHVHEVRDGWAKITWQQHSGWASAKSLGVPVPDTNLRKSGKPLALRDYGADVGAAYGTVPAGAEVFIIEERGSMSYVFDPRGDGLYGWVETGALDIQPNAEVRYHIRQVPPEHRPGVTFGADPSLVLEEGVAKGSELLMTPEVLGVMTPDPHTLVLETWGPVPYMVNVMASRSFRPAPREAVSRWPRRWAFPEHIVTSGPYHLTAWEERDYMRLERSKNYWNPELPKLDKITIYSMNDQAASANYYYRGGCDAVTSNNIPTTYLPVVNGERRGGVPFKDYIAAPYLGSYFYVFNTEKLDNVHLRRALSHAIDRRPLPKVLHGGQFPTHQYVPGTPISQLSPVERELCGVEAQTPGVAMIVEAGKLCYVPPAGPGFDLEKAKAELALARKEMGAKFPDKINLKFNKGVEGHKIIAEYIQHEWQEKLGIEVELQVQEWKTYLKATKAGDFQVARMGWIGSYLDPEQNYMKNFKCANPQNRSRWCSQEFDDLFERIEATADRKERLALLQEAERMMIEDQPIMPLYVYTQHHLQKPYVRGLKVNLTDRVLFQYTWFDKDWRKHANPTEGAPR